MNGKTDLANDPSLLRILFCTYRRARTAQEISRTLGIPIRDTYLKLGTLKKQGLIRVENEIVAPKGNLLRYFKADLKNLYMKVDDMGSRVRLESVFSAMRGP